MDSESKTPGSAAGRAPADGAATDSPSRRGRAHDPEGNRRAVLDAARRLFAAQGYAGVGIRAIAAEAGVTPGLVMAYFGTKDGLFHEAVAGGTGLAADVLEAAGNDLARLPQALAHAYLERWERLPAQDPWPALIRSALDHPPSAALFRTILDQQVGEPLCRLLGDSPEAEVRAAMVRSILFGVIMERYMFAHEPARSVPRAALEPALADALATAVTGRSARSADRPGPAEAVVPMAQAGSRSEADTEPYAFDADADAERPASAAGPAAEPATASATEPLPAPSSVPAGAVFDGLSSCFQHHQSLIGRIAKQYGISPAAFDVLNALRRAGAPHRRTMSEVAAAGQVSQGGLTMQADRLVESGLIERERDGRDRRIVHLRLTPAGLDLADRMAAAREAGEREMLAGLGIAERRQLVGLLDVLGRSPEPPRPQK
ncbi:TetR family transcriptional regulator [Streptomyces sp. NPDC006208]|uniref:TetR/AcrR family transcriptional regulator n=1 Tax=Streptomyces sp. NPDC006208 TaxID=3156734 RepID=UPI0033A13D10